MSEKPVIEQLLDEVMRLTVELDRYSIIAPHLREQGVEVERLARDVAIRYGELLAALKELVASLTPTPGGPPPDWHRVIRAAAHAGIAIRRAE